MDKPFSQACENNKGPILDVLREAFCEAREVLEIGSGTGQHACYLARHLPWLRWQPSDQAHYLPGIALRAEEYRGDNLLPVLELDVRTRPWPVSVPDAVFTANSLHIMAWSAVESLFSALAQQAPPSSHLCIYGPFNYGGQYTSASNAQFDQWLVEQHADSAIRDFEAVDALAITAGYELQADWEMPANNRLLHWRR